MFCFILWPCWNFVTVVFIYHGQNPFGALRYFYPGHSVIAMAIRSMTMNYCAISQPLYVLATLEAYIKKRCSGR